VKSRFLILHNGAIHHGIFTGLKKSKKGGVKPEVLHGANMSNLDFAPGASRDYGSYMGKRSLNMVYIVFDRKYFIGKKTLYWSSGLLV